MLDERCPRHVDGEGGVPDEVAHVGVVYVSPREDHADLDSGEKYPPVLNFLADVLLPLKLSLVIADLG